ncbi:MAG: VWA-like domain-containing protein [Promethearchaeota archaeon]
MEQNSEERLKELIAKFVLKYNYWGYLFSRIRRRPAKHFGSIMGVGPEPDGTISLIYEPDLLAKTEDKEILRIVEHEGMHLLNKHISRLLRVMSNETQNSRKNLKIKAWNIASDCSVNVQANIREPIIIDGMKTEPCLPEKFGLEEGKVTEYYFWELLKNAKIIEIPFYSGGKDGKNGNGGFNDHDQWTKNIQGVADLSSLSRKVEQHIQNIVKESVKNFNKDRGTIPSHIAELIQSALEPPKAPYYQIIAKLVKGTRYTKFKSSPTKINRKRTYVFTLQGDNLIPEISPFPGKKRDMTFDVTILIDTSGSMSQDDIKEGLSGIKHIIEKDRHCYITVLEVDAGVEKEYAVKKVRDIQFNVKGRGGTTLRPGLERARELHCDVCLAFTDGYCEDVNHIPRKYLPKKLIWVITKNGSAKSVNRTGYVVRI